MSKTIVITGASTGIGRAILQQLDTQFPSSTIYSINRKAILIENYVLKGLVVFEEVDLSVRSEVEKICGIFRGKTIDILVNNAGTMPFKRFGEVTVDEYDYVMNVNLRAPFLVSQAIIPSMSRGGRIINVSSIAGGPWIDPDSTIMPYSISKAGLIMLTKQLAKAFPRLRVNSISPGLVGGTSIVGGEATPQALIDTVPTKREATTREVAMLVGYLCSDDADYITGQNIIIDGGKTL